MGKFEMSEFNPVEKEDIDQAKPVEQGQEEVFEEEELDPAEVERLKREQDEKEALASSQQVSTKEIVDLLDKKKKERKMRRRAKKKNLTGFSKGV